MIVYFRIKIGSIPCTENYRCGNKNIVAENEIFAEPGNLFTLSEN